MSRMREFLMRSLRRGTEGKVKRMDKIDEFYASIPRGRCNPCKFSRCIVANGQFMFLGCTHPPYKGKWVAEIKNCPKVAKKDGENNE